MFHVVMVTLYLFSPDITVVAYLLLQPDAIKGRNRSDPRASSNRIINIVNIFIITSAAWYGAFRGPFKMRKYLCCTTEINKASKLSDFKATS